MTQKLHTPTTTMIKEKLSMQPKYGVGQEDDGNDEQRTQTKLDFACEKIVESLAILLVQLVNLRDERRPTIMQQAVGDCTEMRLRISAKEISRKTTERPGELLSSADM